MSGLTDVHVHLAALPEPGNGCLLSKRMREGWLARLVCRVQGLPIDDPATANRLYIERLKRELGASSLVSRAVLLAMDGVYGADGRLDEARTDFLIANDRVLELARGDARFLAGVSINPARRDALEELERCAAQGAALVKMLPNAQAFDPARDDFRPFYRALARLGIPLLSHIGYEFSLIGQDQSVGDPDRLVCALEEGVTVIAAHGCSYGLFLYEKHLPRMVELMARYPRLYADLSALTLPNRAGALLRLARMKDLRGRFLFGTDYPLPTFRYPCLLAGKPAA
ncbi:MAG TPA: amidohydrolase family protein, partial [Elusimicrobiota bacterium]|nr:amidohydrolase family protein [Elusimicrobiota bacterium]